MAQCAPCVREVARSRRGVGNLARIVGLRFGHVFGLEGAEAKAGPSATQFCLGETASVGMTKRYWSCSEVLFQEFEGALASELCSFGVVAGAVAGIEAVARAFVPEDGDVGIDGGNFGVDLVFRDVRVERTEVEH